MYLEESFGVVATGDVSQAGHKKSQGLQQQQQQQHQQQHQQHPRAQYTETQIWQMQQQQCQM